MSTVAKHSTPRRGLDRLIDWGPLVVVPAILVALWPRTWPVWALFWTNTVVLFGCCKWVTCRYADLRTASPGRFLGYAFAWPGLNAAEFLQTVPSERTVPSVAEWFGAFAKLAAGAAILWGGFISVPAREVILRGWFGVVGIVVILFFGSFHLVSCVWRALGVRAEPLMNWPLHATSVGEFWSRRWNRAFHHLAHTFVFRKVTMRFGAAWGLCAVFLFSGLLHEALLSLPVRGGFGLPTLYLLLQPAGIAFERSRLGRALGLGHGLRGWLFSATIVVLPLPLLCHRPFMHRAVAPFLDMLGALPTTP